MVRFIKSKLALFIGAFLVIKLSTPHSIDKAQHIAYNKRVGQGRTYNY